MFRNKDYGPCAQNPCLNNGTCVDQNSDSYKCICPSFYVGKSCEYCSIYS